MESINQKLNLIIVPFHDYKKWLTEGFRTRDSHLYQHFSKNNKINKILIVNRPISLFEMMIRRKSWKLKIGKVEYCKNGIQLTKISDNTWCIDFFVKDFFKVAFQKKDWWYTAFNYKRINDAINDAQKYLDMDKSILFLENPMAVGTVKFLSYDKFVFDAIDNWLYHPQMKNKKLIKENYDYIEKKADLIITVSKALKDFFSKNTNTYWIPNGVDRDFFYNSNNNKIECNMKIGYVGKIQDRIDFNLVEKCLNRFYEYEFIFAGPILSQKKKIRQLKKKYNNIKFVGDVHYNDLPQLINNFDLCIIPHYDDEFTKSMNPLKLYEYMAAGKSVVTNNIAGIENFKFGVYKSGSHEEFLNNIDNALKKKIDKECIINNIPLEYLWSNICKRIIDLFYTIKKG